MRLIDLKGKRFGKLVVTGRVYDKEKLRTRWECECDCGNKINSDTNILKSGRVHSCGCDNSERRRKNMVGERYGRLTVKKFVGMAPNRVSIWEVECDCGAVFNIRRSNLVPLKNGKVNTVSCGCHKKDFQRKRHLTHGDSKSKEYNCWQNMFQRCYNENHSHYKWYGAKGVTICKRWSEYENFLADVGRAPDGKPCIDRIDPYGNYEPDNIRWVDFATSNSNKRT